MDREIDQRPEREDGEGNQPRAGREERRDTVRVPAPAPDVGRSAPPREPGERPTEYFSVRLTLSGTAQEYEDPREAGAAFFRADPTERPSVTHVAGNTARTMARTEVHGAHETGEPRYFKTLPESHAPDAAFRAGFLQAMEASISERLDKVELDKDGAKALERLEPGLKEDLEAFARREPEKAAALWASRTEEPAPGPTLQAAVQAREVEAGREAGAPDLGPGAAPAATARPEIVAAGDWVTTDRDVDLRPVAVETEHGIHTGYEARIPGGESEITRSERTFARRQEALGHAWDFYEGGEHGLETAVERKAEMHRGLEDDAGRAPLGLVLEHREQPEFPRPETAIYAGEEAQLVMTLGRDTERSRALAEKLVADPEFRELVAGHIPDAQTTIGPGRFTDGQGSVFLPDEPLVVTSYDRDGSAEVVATFPDESPLSTALARHLTTSPVLAAHLAEDRERVGFAADPAKALAAWVGEASSRIDGLPRDRQDGLRAEVQEIAREAATAFGLDRVEVASEAPPRSTIYSASLSASSLTLGSEEVALPPDAASTLKTALRAAAAEAGIDGTRIERRLASGAAHAGQEEDWVKSDISDVAQRHQLDLGGEAGRSRAAELVDRFYERAAELIHSARSAEVTRAQDPLFDALAKLASVHASQGVVRFRTEDQAQGFAEEMQDRYGASILKDMAAGRTEALARDIPDPAARQAIAAAVVAAAREHPSLGPESREPGAAERDLPADGPGSGRPRVHAQDLGRDREF